jgi:hypothetical protein
MKLLQITCKKCNNHFKTNFEEMPIFIKPGIEFGITTKRFYIIPRVYCCFCNSECEVELLEENTVTKTNTEIIKKY